MSKAKELLGKFEEGLTGHDIDNILRKAHIGEILVAIADAQTNQKIGKVLYKAADEIEKLE